jgi:hypothetical protein
MAEEESGFVVISEELLAKASPEEREAYYQYLLARVVEADEWQPWINMFFPQAADRPFSEGHQKFWEWVWEVEPAKRPKPWVSIWPRGHGKSTSAELAVVAVAARKKRKYGIYVSETQDQADDHVANVAAMLESDTIEMAYPELGERLMGKFGTSKGWRRNRIRTKTGFTLDAMGLDSAARGVKLEDQRPDFMVFDDIDGELDTDERVEKKIKTITRKLLPAGAQDCAILMVQNLVHDNSIFARLADGRADFLRDRIVSGPIPAIFDLEYEERDAKFVITGGEPSWPEGFPVDSCQLLMNDIGLSAFLAECQHETKPPEGDIFSHLTFIRVAHDDVPKLRRAVVWVDPAVTTTDASDSMGIQVDGLGIDDKIYRLFSWENRSTPYRAIHLAVEKALEYGADTVGVETNQGGDLWKVVFDQVVEDIRSERGDSHMKMPRYRQEKATADLGSKITRAERMLVDYERGLFVHVEGTHHALELALRRFPKVKPFDLVDAAYWSWAFLAGPLHRRKSKVKSSARRYLQTPTGIGSAPATVGYN